MSCTFPRCAGIVLLPLAVPVLSGAEASLEPWIAKLSSPDPWDRERGAAEILRSGPSTLPRLLRVVEAPEDRILFFRIEKIFSEILDGLLAELESEHRSLVLQQGELKALQDRQRSAEAREELRKKIDEIKKEDPAIMEKLEALVSIERIEELEKLQAGGAVLPLDDRLKEELGRLRKLREEWRAARADFDAAMEPLLKLARIQLSGAEDEKLTDLDLLRVKELEERVADRAPRAADLALRVQALGLPAVNCLLARRISERQQDPAFYDGLVSSTIQKFQGSLFPEEGSSSSVGYCRSCLWAWLAERKDREEGLGARAEASLARHLSVVLADLGSPEPIVRDRSADELYLLGPRGTEALRKQVGTAGDPASSRDGFLLDLLRWRIRPRLYARTGTDFEDYPSLEFREKRRKIFDYARTAGEASIPTLRAIISDDQLEKSLFVKLAAARALAGFRDLTGYTFLRAKHPDLTLRRPEVSRELLLIQGFEYIRDKNYKRAIEELRKLLDESPFDFRGNYHIAFAYLLEKNYAKAVYHFEICRRINAKDQLTLYNLACAYALSGKKEEALEALEAAVDSGFDDWEHIEKDPDLDSIREAPRYRNLIDLLKSSQGR